MSDGESSSTSSTEHSITSIELITFDKNLKLIYEGFCKIILNNFDKVLVIKTDDIDIYVPFDRQLIFKKNVLLILAPKKANDLVLYFSKDGKCEKVYEAIMTAKSDISNLLFDQQIFNERFVLPLLDETYSSGNLRLKTILNDCIYIPVSQPTINERHQVEENTANLITVKTEPEDEDDIDTSQKQLFNLKTVEENSSNHQSPLPTKSFQQFDFDCENESIDLVSNVEPENDDFQGESLLLTKVVEESSSEPPQPNINFSLIDFDGEDDENLSLMGKAEPDAIDFQDESVSAKEMEENNSESLASSTIISPKQTTTLEEEYESDDLNENDDIIKKEKPQQKKYFKNVVEDNDSEDEFDLQKLREVTIKVINFVNHSSKNVIFDDEPPSKTQKLNNNVESNNPKIVISNASNPDDFGSSVDGITTNKVITSEGFEIRFWFKNGNKKRFDLIIQNSNNKSYCYRYNFHPLHKRFICSNCRIKFRKYVFASLHKNELGEYYVELNNGGHQHECLSLATTLSNKNEKILHKNNYEKLLYNNNNQWSLKKSFSICMQASNSKNTNNRRAATSTSTAPSNQNRIKSINYELRSTSKKLRRFKNKKIIIF